MIVKDKAVTLQKANEISNRFMKILRQELRRCHPDFEDDPGEHLYLLIQIISNFLAKMILLSNNYGEKMYNMPNTDIDYLRKTVNSCSEEYIKAFMNIKVT